MSRRASHVPRLSCFVWCSQEKHLFSEVPGQSNLLLHFPYSFSLSFSGKCVLVMAFAFWQIPSRSAVLSGKCLIAITTLHRLCFLANVSSFPNPLPVPGPDSSRHALRRRWFRPPWEKGWCHGCGIRSSRGCHPYHQDAGRGGRGPFARSLV